MRALVVFVVVLLAASSCTCRPTAKIIPVEGEWKRVESMELGIKCKW